ncbi:MAG: glutamine synthetase family protein [Elusimicrobiota bacterium]
MSEISAIMNKSKKNFTKQDIVKFIKKRGIRVVNFRYIASDGRLKTLNIPASDPKHLDRILSCGERVDGSSLFKDIDPSSSDLYIVPIYSTIFENPFSEIPGVDIICNFFNKNGSLFESAPDNILRKAQRKFEEITGYEIKMFGELEYYVISPRNELYPMRAQKGYHESYPFNKWENLRVNAMHLIQNVGASVKYAHSEVGFIRTEDREMSQNEIEFLPESPLDSAYHLLIAKWILHSLGNKYGVIISFAPKISIGHAGSGLHIHSCIYKNGKNVMIKNNVLSDEALKLIAGFLRIARSATAFGNTLPTSYLRLVPNQEAPVKISWGYRNRNALIRVPLGWDVRKDMSSEINPGVVPKLYSHSQTIEFRSGDGSANIPLYLASLICGAIKGFSMKEYKEIVDSHFVDETVKKEFEPLPSSCNESASQLLRERKLYEENSIFPPKLIDSVAKKLHSYDDANLSEKLYGKEEDIKKLVEQYLYC